VLRGSESFQWGPKQQASFDALKDHIQKLPTLASPQPDQPLILYVSATHTTVSGDIVQEREVCKEGRKLSQQVLIYFVFEALVGSKKYYSEMEKICYAVVMSARKLCHYFEVHRGRVLTNQPLNDIFKNRHCLGRIGKWAMEPSDHVIDFEKRSTIKSQELADFVADWTEPSSYTEDLVIDTPWEVYCDGSCGVSRAGVAAILTSHSGVKLRYAARLQFKAETDKCSNNVVEYKAVLLGL
jgi:hypothetical protein